MSSINKVRVNNVDYDVIDFNLIYPIGSVYTSTANTNPSTLFGGTWQEIQQQTLNVHMWERTA